MTGTSRYVEENESTSGVTFRTMCSLAFKLSGPTDKPGVQTKSSSILLGVKSASSTYNMFPKSSQNYGKNLVGGFITTILLHAVCLQHPQIPLVWLRAKLIWYASARPQPTWHQLESTRSIQWCYCKNRISYINYYILLCIFKLICLMKMYYYSVFNGRM